MSDKPTLEQMQAHLKHMREEVEKAQLPRPDHYHEWPKLEPAKGCTCRSQGTCETCVAYGMIIADAQFRGGEVTFINGEPVKVPRGYP